ncbi:MAG: hypothetical protein ACREPD_08015 [Stenotrophomonas sp.]|uniref:hypothetical protein n=1 Tax=Stenotrophomonas sp. TaxID=69392 RepID=UPI003D6D48E1
MIKRSRATVSFLTALLVCACAPTGTTKPTRSGDQSLLDVASDPYAFDGRDVSITAWITYRHEDLNAWATARDHEEWNTVRCLSLSNYDSFDKDLKALDGRYARISGAVVSDASEGGSLLRFGACRDVAIRLISVSHS